MKSAGFLVLLSFMFYSCGTEPDLEPDPVFNGDYLLFKSDYVIKGREDSKWIIITDQEGNLLASTKIQVEGPLEIYGPQVDTVNILFLSYSFNEDYMFKSLQHTSYYAVPTNYEFEFVNQYGAEASKPDSIGNIFIELSGINDSNNEKWGTYFFVNRDPIQENSSPYLLEPSVWGRQATNGLFTGKMQVFSEKSTMYAFRYRDGRPVYYELHGIEVGDTVRFSTSDFMPSIEFSAHGSPMVSAKLQGLPVANAELYGYKISDRYLARASNSTYNENGFLFGYIDVFDWYNLEAAIYRESDDFAYMFIEHLSLTQEVPETVTFPEYQISMNNSSLDELDVRFDFNYTIKNGDFEASYEENGLDYFFRTSIYAPYHIDFKQPVLPDEILAEIGFKADLDIKLTKIEFQHHLGYNSYFDLIRDQIEYRRLRSKANKYFRVEAGCWAECE